MKKLNGDWYHDFSKLGLDTKNGSGYQKNQVVKEETINEMFNIVKSENPNVNSLLDVFTSDGYYTFLINKLFGGFDKITSVDLDPVNRYYPQYDIIRKELGIDSSFVKNDINYFLDGDNPRYGITICFGGLYHIHNPAEVINRLLKISDYVLIQTVVPSDIRDEEYFITPAPNWKHGSRFSVFSINKWIDDMDCVKIYENYNELTNDDAVNKGSYYCVLKSNNIK